MRQGDSVIGRRIRWTSRGGVVELDNPLSVLDGAVVGCPAQDFPKFLRGTAEKRIAMGSICWCACDATFDDSMHADASRRHFKRFGSIWFHIVPFQFASTSEIVAHA